MQTSQVISLIALFGDLFLNLLKMMVLPLIICSMITGVTSIRSTGVCPTAPQPRQRAVCAIVLCMRLCCVCDCAVYAISRQLQARTSAACPFGRSRSLSAL
jgi:L-cystine uptake protein TcyP (sodium:dicarboxylate symporter family)